MTITPASLEFLRDLAAHNDRDWFQANKHRYEAAHQNMLGFAEALHERVSQDDLLEAESGKKILFRIYRDVRFSANKAPYKNNFAGRLKRATAARRGGYYFQVQPGRSFQGGGFWAPNKDDLLRIRQDIAAEPEPLRSILAAPSFREYFGELRGDAVKTAPKGFSQDHPAIDLLRHKAFIVRREFSDEQVLSADFVDQLAEGFLAMRPFFDYMSEVLTTDANGVSLLADES